MQISQMKHKTKVKNTTQHPRDVGQYQEVQNIHNWNSTTKIQIVENPERKLREQSRKKCRKILANGFPKLMRNN